MKVYMKVSDRDQLDICTKNLRALNFAHVKLNVVSPRAVEELVLVHDRSMTPSTGLIQAQNDQNLDGSEAQMSVEEFIEEVSKVHADLVVIPCGVDKDELALLIEKTPCSILINRCCMEGEFSIKTVLATDHTLYANLAIEKFRSFRPSGFSGATVISTELNGETSTGVAKTQSMRVIDVEAARTSESESLPMPLLKAISQECRAREANLLMVATHSLRNGQPNTLGSLLPEIIDSVNASVLILKAY
ncbi:MAG TPA: hypothetical protein VK171_09150 [Fimbriimonas sp.]|nr:hypothetical protein [Fimbriimonas sp.]